MSLETKETKYEEVKIKSDGRLSHPQRFHTDDTDNDLWKIYAKYATKEIFDKHAIATHRLTSFDKIKRHIKYLPIYSVAENPNVGIKEYRELKEMGFNINDNCQFSANPNMTHAKLVDARISISPFLFCKNPNATPDFIQKNKDGNLSWFYLSKNQSVPLEFVSENLDLPWDYDSLSSNPNINIKFVLDHPEFNFNWVELSKNPGITWTDIDNNPNLPWNMKTIPYNPNVQFEMIKDKPVSTFAMSCNPSVTWTTFKTYPDYLWNIYGLSQNPNITPELILETWEKIDWSLDNFSSNVNLTEEAIKKINAFGVNPRNNTWCFSNISANPFRR